MGAAAFHAGQLLAGAELAIRLCEHIEDADGAVVFRAACTMALEGIVAKRRDSHPGRAMSTPCAARVDRN